jgi:hypothetical protein
MVDLPGCLLVLLAPCCPSIDTMYNIFDSRGRARATAAERRPAGEQAKAQGTTTYLAAEPSSASMSMHGGAHGRVRVLYIRLALSSQPPNYITLNEHLAYSINQNSSTICIEICRARDGFLIGTHSKMLSATTMPGIRGGGR